METGPTGSRVTKLRRLLSPAPLEHFNLGTYPSVALMKYSFDQIVGDYDDAEKRQSRWSWSAIPRASGQLGPHQAIPALHGRVAW